jgi:hypothetical protein
MEKAAFARVWQGTSMKICVRPEAGSRENRARDIATADGMMARGSHDAIVVFEKLCVRIA